MNDVTFQEIKDIFATRDYEVEQVEDKIHCDDLIFNNCQEALDWFEESENEILIKEHDELVTNFKKVQDAFHAKGYSFECCDADFVSEAFGEELNFETLENAVDWIEKAESTPGDESVSCENEINSKAEVETVQEITIKFSEIKNAVKFFSSFISKDCNAVQISHEGFRYLKCLYKCQINISDTFYVNLTHLKDFVNIYTGRDFSNVTLDFSNEKISGKDLILPLAKQDIKFTELDENNFSDLVKVSSATLKTLVSAASKNKREPELQVLNFRIKEFRDGSEVVELAATDASQLYIWNHTDKLQASLKEIQIKSEIVNKFLNFANKQVTFEVLNTSLLMQSGNYTLVNQFSDAEFTDYSQVFESDIQQSIGCWNVSFLANLYKQVKKIANKEFLEIKFTNQGDNVNYLVILHDNQISDGSFTQAVSNWTSFKVGGNDFCNLLTNTIKDCRKLTLSQSEECVIFTTEERKNLQFVLLTDEL